MSLRRDPLGIDISSMDGTLAITLAGQADAEALDRIRRAFEASAVETKRRLLLRLAELESCDTPAAWELLELVRDAKDSGVDVHVESLPNQVVKTMLVIADVRNDLGLDDDGPGRRA